MRTGRDEVPSVADGERPDLAMVTIELLNALELPTRSSVSAQQRERIKRGRTLSPSQYLTILSLLTLQK